MLSSARDPLQEALNSRRSFSYNIPSSHSNFFKTSKYDFNYLWLTFPQRIAAFAICLVAGALLSMYAFMNILSLSAGAFIKPYAIANILFFIMFGFPTGFKTYFKNLFSPTKRIFTTAFLVSTILTFYAVYYNKGWIIRFFLTGVQISTFISFAITFIPGGASGMMSLINLFIRK
ncbi:hypothetical protein ENBRE01_0622 [Enteropsectra breve]|nr:hypothetical protein ENBRE01_0622 [Enteropsectra breve]